MSDFTFYDPDESVTQNTFTVKVSGPVRAAICNCSHFAPPPVPAKFCRRCGGRIRRPSAVLPWINGAALRPIQMAAALVATPFLVLAICPAGCASLDISGTQGWYAGAWRWWLRMILPTTLKRILS